jgi:3-methylfumaryl-CoA hydratase
LTIDIAHLRTWIGKSQTTAERIAPFPSNALAATLDCDETYVDNTPLPPLWHWLHFLPLIKRAETGADGHAALGGFLPPVPLPRRMWAGGRLTLKAPMRIGRTLRKTSTVTSVDHKTGRSGDLVFVKVQHQVFDGDLLGIAEDQDIVYRAFPAHDAPAPAPTPAPKTSTYARVITPDPVLLFRYSALTFNGHRIHYDHPFCRKTEGYPGLVVHGPLLATLLLDLLRCAHPGAEVASFTFRAIAPVYDTEVFSIHAEPAPDGASVDLWVCRHDGALAMIATATL